MASFHGVVVILMVLTTSHSFPQFRMPFYKTVLESPVRLMAASRDSAGQGHKTHSNDHNVIPVTLDGRKYIMMSVDDADSDRNENMYQSGNMNHQVNKYVRYQPQQNMLWNRNQEQYNNKNEGSKNLLFYKGDDGKLMPVQRSRFTDWLYGLFSRFQKTPVKKDPEPETETTEVNIIHRPVVPQPPPAYQYDNVYTSPQQQAPYPPPYASNGYPYPYPYFPNYQYGPNFNPYSGKPNRIRPPGYVNKDPTLQQFESLPAGEGTADYSPYPPLEAPEVNTATSEESAEEEEEEPQESEEMQRTVYVMPKSRKSTGGFVW